jgi:hypothetical protein
MIVVKETKHKISNVELLIIFAVLFVSLAIVFLPLN